jgi:hypothetical protein
MASRQDAQTWMFCTVGTAGWCKRGRNAAAGLKSRVKSGGILVCCLDAGWLKDALASKPAGCCSGSGLAPRRACSPR